MEQQVLQYIYTATAQVIGGREFPAIYSALVRAGNAPSGDAHASVSGVCGRGEVATRKTVQVLVCCAGVQPIILSAGRFVQ